MEIAMWVIAALAVGIVVVVLPDQIEQYREQKAYQEALEGLWHFTRAMKSLSATTNDAVASLSELAVALDEISRSVPVTADELKAVGGILDEPHRI